MNDNINVDLTKKSPLIDEDTIEESNVEELSNLKVDKDILAESEDELSLKVPSEYIPIKLVSNGRIEGIPKVLHFRDYSVSESLDINTFYPEDKPKVVSDILTKMCYEHFDISTLPIQDVLYILYTIHANFISNSITKTIYLDESLPKGNKKGQLDNESNIEEIDIPITSLNFTYLGKDKNDNNLKDNIRIPFKIIDTKSKVEVEFKITSLSDSILAQNYCKNLYHDDLIKFSAIRKELDDILSIRDSKTRNSAMDAYLEKNFDLSTEYYKFRNKYDIMLAHLIQAQQIVSYQGKPLNDLKEKWDVYSTNITSGLWGKYLKVVENFVFGINSEVEVYSLKLNKKFKRNFGFQLSDFLSIDRPQDSDRYDVLFD